MFPTLKYRLVHDSLVAHGITRPEDFIEPQPATWDELALVHTSEYLEKMRTGTIAPDDVAQLELPWSEEMVDGSSGVTRPSLRARWSTASRHSRVAGASASSARITAFTRSRVATVTTAVTVLRRGCSTTGLDL